MQRKRIKIHPIFNLFIEIAKKNKGKDEIQLTTPTGKIIEFRFKEPYKIRVSIQKEGCEIIRSFELFMDMFPHDWPEIKITSSAKFLSPVDDTPAELNQSDSVAHHYHLYVLNPLSLRRQPHCVKELDCLVKMIKEATN